MRGDKSDYSHSNRYQKDQVRSTKGEFNLELKDGILSSLSWLKSRGIQRNRSKSVSQQNIRRFDFKDSRRVAQLDHNYQSAY